MLTQSGIFCLGLLEDGYAGIGVLPELKEITIRFASSYGIMAAGESSCLSQSGESPEWKIQDHTAMIK